MSFWSPQYMDSTDPENDKIWVESPTEQAMIQPAGSLKRAGDIGAQQVMVEALEISLPWVPDILGVDWKDSESVMMLGSAYAPFIRGISRRDYTLPLKEYVDAQSAKDFLASFLNHVVLPDLAYYDKIRLLAKDLGDQRKIALFDLCRASYTVRGTRCSHNTMDEAAEYTFKNKLPPKKDKAKIHSPARAEASRRLFTNYVEAPKQRAWTLQRFSNSEARRIIALGQVAEYGLLKLFWDHGIRTIYQRSSPGDPWFPSTIHSDKWVLNYARAGQTLECWLDEDDPNYPDWWVVEGRLDDVPRRWHLLPVLHPMRNAADSDYSRTRKVLQIM